jgi:quercetin dioxygenase-like cupin family protein
MSYARLSALLFLVLTLACGTAVRADDYQQVKVTRLITSTTASNGQKLSYRCTDRPEVTALIVEIPPGGETGWHLHAVPVYAYMLAGGISVETGDGKSFEFKEGDAILEVLDTAHNGRNRGTVPARLVVFYTGEEGKPNVTRLEKPAAAK